MSGKFARAERKRNLVELQRNRVTQLTVLITWEKSGSYIKFMTDFILGLNISHFVVVVYALIPVHLIAPGCHE